MDDAEARAILRQGGEQPPARGKLGADWMERAAELAASATGQNGAEPGEPGDDYDQGVSAADFDGVSVADEPPSSPHGARAAAAAAAAAADRWPIVCAPRAARARASPSPSITRG